MFHRRKRELLTSDGAILSFSDSKSEPDEYTSDIAMKLKDILIEFVFSVFEGFAVSFLFINENTSILNGLK